METLKTTYFKIIGQKTAGKLVLIAVLPEDSIGEVPNIFEVQAMLMPKTIYSGTYPDIRINTDTIVDVFDELKGSGINNIITSAHWYIKQKTESDLFGISINRSYDKSK